uniref:Uncharacterized protein n=1 Tax=Setaria viridis TaxID=4556 RepID=A0A4U6V0L8_SETVI|nr:hypothetical protein SEVIR_4G171600v2 [Setaria viridis]
MAFFSPRTARMFGYSHGDQKYILQRKLTPSSLMSSKALHSSNGCGRAHHSPSHPLTTYPPSSLLPSRRRTLLSSALSFHRKPEPLLFFLLHLASLPSQLDLFPPSFSPPQEPAACSLLSFSLSSAPPIKQANSLVLFFPKSISTFSSSPISRQAPQAGAPLPSLSPSSVFQSKPIPTAAALLPFPSLAQAQAEPAARLEHRRLDTLWRFGLGMAVVPGLFAEGPRSSTASASSPTTTVGGSRRTVPHGARAEAAAVPPTSAAATVAAA